MQNTAGVIHVRKNAICLIEISKKVETYLDFQIGNTQNGNSWDLSNYAEIRQVCIEEEMIMRVKWYDGNDKDEKG